jgi:hypothetical protein
MEAIMILLVASALNRPQKHKAVGSERSHGDARGESDEGEA